MPYIKVSSNVASNKVDKDAAIAAISKSLADTIQRDEAYVMAHLELDQQLVSSKANTDPAAFVYVRSIANFSAEANGKIYADLTETVSKQLGVASGRVFIIVENVEMHNWGWDGKAVQL